VFESSVLRRIFGPKREEVVVGWRRLHNEELHNLCASPNIITVIKSRTGWVGHAVRMGEMRNVYTILVGEPEGKRQLGERRWEDNIRMDLRELGWEVVEWMHMIQDRDQWRTVVNMVMNLRVQKRREIS
jgi:hypothetical protein